jgi:hypothetical protein
MRDVLGAVVLSALALTGLASPAWPMVEGGTRWMAEEAMRQAFIGSTLDGHYVDGLRWSETYTADGRLDYREAVRRGVGYWYFRDHVFCTFYDPGQGLSGGCWTAVKVSSNCYEFYVADLAAPSTADEAAPRLTSSFALNPLAQAASFCRYAGNPVPIPHTEARKPAHVHFP